MSEERITLAPGEGLPGFPSGHGPGQYLVDFEARTMRPVPVVEETQPESEIVTESQPETENQGG